MRTCVDVEALSRLIAEGAKHQGVLNLLRTCFGCHGPDTKVRLEFCAEDKAEILETLHFLAEMLDATLDGWRLKRLIAAMDRADPPPWPDSLRN